MEEIINRMLTIEVFFYTLFIVAVPVAIRQINVAMHRYGDPPWKKEEYEQESE